MKMLKLFKNQSGVTLIESMVAMSILSVISLTVATLLKDAGEGVKTNEAKSEITGLKNILLSNFTDTAACTNTFGLYITQANLTAATGSGLVTIAFIKNKINVSTYSTASTNVRPLTITGMYLTNYSSAGFTADLLVKTTFQKSSTKVVNLKDIRVPINMNIGGTTASPTLISCSTMAVGDDWMLAGNSGTVDGTDYIGTSDNVPLNFKVNAQRAGRIDSIGVTTFGYQAGNSPSYLGHMMTAFGYKAASGASSGQNSAFGFQALMTGSANRNTAIGWGALSLGVTGIDNTAVGVSALSNNQGIENTGLGHGALAANTTGSQNTAVGARVMPYTTSGNNNTAFGYHIMYGSSGYAGSGNTAVGTGIMYNNSGSWNSVLGAGALSRNSTGAYNTAVGGEALAVNTTGTNNTAVGERSGRFNSSGNYNTFVGAQAAPTLGTGSNNVFLGYNAGTGVGNSSNKLYIEASGATTPLIFGDFSSSGRYVTINGNLGVGTTTIGTPSTPVVATAGVVRLHVTGGKTILDQEAWTIIPLTSAWTHCAYGGAKSIAKYFKDSNGMVHFRGCIRPTANLLYDFQSVAFSLPTGHNPDSPVAFWGPLVRRPEAGMVWATTKSTSWCYLYMDGGGSANFFVQSETAMGIGDGCELHMIHYRAEN